MQFFFPTIKLDILNVHRQFSFKTFIMF